MANPTRTFATNLSTTAVDTITADLVTAGLVQDDGTGDNGQFYGVTVRGKKATVVMTPIAAAPNYATAQAVLDGYASAP